MSKHLGEVAKQAGVSEATVSRVLNGRSGVAGSTRDAVLTALDVIGYERPTQFRRGRGRMVALVVPELQNPIFPAVAEVVTGALAQRGINAVLCTRTGSMSEADYVDMLLERQVSGMIFAGGQYAENNAPHEHYHLLRRLRLPVVLINAAARGLDFPCVATDDAAAIGQAVGHLASLGHRDIGLILGPKDHEPSRRKLEAFQALGHTVDPTRNLVERSMFSLESGQAAATRLLRAGVTGIVCASDPLALGAVRAARRCGRSVPGAVSVVGYDDSTFMTCVDPPLTTVRQPIETIGRAAVQMLTGLMEGSSVTAEELVFEPELVVRSSTGPVAG
jgi:DNA-binding LacI/PurR family transcriptional regulator